MEEHRSAFTWSHHAQAGQQEVFRPTRARLCGLSKRMFWAVFAIILVVLGAAIGGGIAGGLSMSQKQKATQGSVNGSSSQPTTIAPASSVATGSLSNIPTGTSTATSISTATPSPGFYAIVNTASNTAIDLFLGNANANTQINGWLHYLDNGKEVDNPNQKWMIAAVGNGFSVIMNGATGSYISAPKGLVSGSNPVPGDLSRALGGPGLPNDNYNLWQIKLFADGTIAIASKVYPTKFLDMSNSGVKDGTPVLLWEDNNGGRNQRWKLNPA